ncbi:hypothetical protein HYV81_06560 [Candidatus Woesearchaeota archaeon]|nr:hypothetical protein [Candidatus Woesearchaeota archaeon]
MAYVKGNLAQPIGGIDAQIDQHNALGRAGNRYAALTALVLAGGLLFAAAAPAIQEWYNASWDEPAKYNGHMIGRFDTREP